MSANPRDRPVSRPRSARVQAAFAEPPPAFSARRGSATLSRVKTPVVRPEILSLGPQSAPSQVTLGLEMVAKIGVNILLTAASLAGLARLVPLQLAQHNRTQLLDAQVHLLSTRTARLRDGVERGMDPSQQDALIKEWFNQVPPNQLQVKLVPLSPPPLSARTEQRSATARRQP